MCTLIAVHVSHAPTGPCSEMSTPAFTHLRRSKLACLVLLLCCRLLSGGRLLSQLMAHTRIQIALLGQLGLQATMKAAPV